MSCGYSEGTRPCPHCMKKENEARGWGNGESDIMVIQWVEERLVLLILGPYGIPPMLEMSVKDN